MKGAILLIAVALLQLSVAFPTNHLAAKKNDFDEECPATIEIPRWFCRDMESKVRPDWLDTICKVFEPNPEVQQNIEINDRVCLQPTEEARVRFVQMLCNEGELTGMICAANADQVREVIRAECGPIRQNLAMGYPPRGRRDADSLDILFPPQGMQRGRHDTDSLDLVLCSNLGNPDTLEVVNMLCKSEQDKNRLGRLSIVCSSSLENRQQQLRAICGGIHVKRAKMSVSSATPSPWATWARRAETSTTNSGGITHTYNKEMCAVFKGPNFLEWLTSTCNNREEDIEDYGIQSSICNEDNPVQVLLRGCPNSEPRKRRKELAQARAMDTIATIPDDICSHVNSKGYLNFLDYVCQDNNNMKPETYGIPKWICKTNLTELPHRCNTDKKGVGMPSVLSMDNDTEDKMEMTRIPDWICDNLSQLGLSDFIGSVCKTNDRLQRPEDLCKPSRETGPKIFP